MNSMSCFSERPRRSRRQTTRTSPLRSRARACSRPDRRAWLPLATSTKSFSQRAFLRASFCKIEVLLVGRDARAANPHMETPFGLCQIVEKLVKLNRLPYVEFLTGFLHPELQAKLPCDRTRDTGKRNGRFLYRRGQRINCAQSLHPKAIWLISLHD